MLLETCEIYENREEGCDDLGDVVALRTSTSRRMSPAGSRTEHGLQLLARNVARDVLKHIESLSYCRYGTGRGTYPTFLLSLL
jgi:hypothetical protein